MSAADGDDGVDTEEGGVPVGGACGGGGGGGGPPFGGKTGGMGQEAGGIGVPIGSGIGDPLGLNNLEYVVINNSYCIKGSESTGVFRLRELAPSSQRASLGH